MNNPSKLTKLPDGSAFFVATVMSKDEAMKLPVEQRPICFRISSDLWHSIFEAIGEASGCWVDGQIPTGVFDSERASRIATNLCFKVAREIENVQHRESNQ